MVSKIISLALITLIYGSAVEGYAATTSADRGKMSKVLGLNPGDAMHFGWYKEAKKAGQELNRDWYVGKGYLPPLGGAPMGPPPAGLILNDAILNNEATMAEIMRHIADEIGITPLSKEFLFLKAYLRKYKHEPADARELKQFMADNLTPFIKNCFDFPRKYNILRYQPIEVAMLGFDRAIKDIVSSYHYNRDLNPLNLILLGGVYEETVNSFRTLLQKDPSLARASNTLPRDTAFPMNKMTALQERLKSVPLFRELPEEQHRRIKAAEDLFDKARLRLSFVYCLNQLDQLKHVLAADLSNLPEWTYTEIFRLTRDDLVAGAPGTPVLKQDVSSPGKILKGLVFANDAGSVTFQDMLRKDQVPSIFKKALCYILLNAPLSADNRAWIKKTLELKPNPFTHNVGRRGQDRVRIVGKLADFDRQLNVPVAPPPARDPADDDVGSFADRKGFFQRGGLPKR